MNKEDFKYLKRGIVLTQRSQYFIVCDKIDDTFIDTQELSDIGKKHEFGFNHSNLNYKYSEIVTDEKVLNAIDEWLKIENSDYEPYSFIAGYCIAKEV